MHNCTINLKKIQDKLKYKKKINIIAVSKTFAIDKILPLVDFGHIHYGENKVQEALDKWTDIKKLHKKIKLHMIGKLQTNKVKYVIPLFDYIHSLDNLKLAEKIATEQINKEKKIKLFIQVNIGQEIQKSGLPISDLENFYRKCTEELKLNIVGLMCIPPQHQQARKYFKKMSELNKILDLKELSMGMSEDYEDAVNYGATFLRIGSKIFGNRI